MKLARLAILILFFCFAFQNLSFSQSNSEEDVEETGGIYPTEGQATGSNRIEADRQELGSYGSVPKAGYTDQLHISSQTQNEIRPNYFILEGYVDISNKGIRLQADHAEYDTVTRDLIATGNVVLDQEGQRITGDRLEMNLDEGTGSLYNVFGYVPPQIFFWGTRLDKLGEDEYKLYDGVFTECSQIVPHWQLKTSSTRMTFNEYAHFTNFTLKAKKIPIFYSPYMIWPIKRDRSTGFLFPGFGPNDNKGFWFGGSFFWAMTRSMDSTYWIDHWALRGWAGGAEYRYATGEKSGGSSKFYYADDQELGPQWTLNVDVKQDLPADFRVAGVADVFSSFEYIQDADNSFSGSARRQQRAQGFLTRNWSYYSMNLLGDFSETQFRQNEVQLFHLPEFEFQARSQKIGPTPLFWTFAGSVDHLGRADVLGKNTLSFNYQRYDMFPGISYPITYLSWLTLTPGFGYRITHYTARQLEAGTIPVVGRDPLTRKYMDLSLDLRGPNFSKIFDTPTLAYSQKWKHAIEPQISYRYIQDIEEIASILRIDDVDDVFGLNVVTYSITNLLYSKRPIKEEPEYEADEYQFYNPKSLEEEIFSPWELISWKISQSYSLQSDRFNVERFPELKPLSPIFSDLRINPSLNNSIDFGIDWDVYAKQITSVKVGSTLRSVDRWYANVSYTYSNPVPIEIPGFRTRADTHQIRTNGGFGIFKNRFVFSGEIDYDFIDKQLFRNSLGVLYNDDCFTVGVEWRRWNVGSQFSQRRENQITFSISLPNIGSLIDFRSGAPPRRF